MGRASIDLSHVIEHGKVTYPGLPAPVVCDYLSREASRARYAPGTEFHIGRIDMVANTGTYVDSPFHRYEGARDVAGLELSRLADIPIVVVRARDRGVIDRDAFDAVDEPLGGKAVLFDTGWSRHYGSPAYFEGHPFLTDAAALHLVQADVALVGIDSLNIDDVSGGARPVHSRLLGADIPIVEHLAALDALPPSGARFFAVPPKVRGMGTFPVRAFALV